MTDKEFTDDEIIKVLECFAYSDGCERCQYSKQCDGAEHSINALDLITRQKSEIERLELANDEKFRQWDILAEKAKQHYADLYNEAKDILKAEAYKEFAEKLKEKIGECHIVSDGEYCGFDCGDIHRCIDNFLKEMVGEEML